MKQTAMQRLDRLIEAQRSSLRQFVRNNAYAVNEDQRTGTRIAVGLCETTLNELEAIRKELVAENTIKGLS